MSLKIVFGLLTLHEKDTGLGVSQGGSRALASDAATMTSRESLPAGGQWALELLPESRPASSESARQGSGATAEPGLLCGAHYSFANGHVHGD